jgi:hypothetical protein
MLRPACTALAIALGTCAGALGCAAEPSPPANAPPAPLPEFISGPTAPGMLWVAGCWHWDGAAYVWLPGHWESPPQIAAQ